MKITQLTDNIRNITRQKVSWFSVCLIVALGVTSYLGIIYASESIKRSGANFYDETAFRDIQAVSTLMFSESDVDAIKNIDGVSYAEGFYQTTAVVKNETRTQNVTVNSLTENVSVPIVLQGRLPKKPTECVLESKLMEKLSLSVGDTISLLTANGNTANYMIQPDYLIVGEVLHPDHITVRLPENLYVLVTREAFDPLQTMQSFMRADIRVEAARGFNPFEDDYFKAISKIQDELSSLGIERSKLRDSYVWDILEATEAQIEIGWTTYKDARKILSLAENDVEEEVNEEYEVLWQDYAAKAKEKYGIDVEYIAEYQAKKIKESTDEAYEALNEYKKTLLKAEKQYEEIHTQIEEIGACRWFSFDRMANAAFVDLSMVASNLGSLAMSFSLLFVVVGALVCYATIGRMADEQRSLIGAEKALGFFASEIFKKYAIFALTSVIVGIILGTALAYWGLQSVICKGYAGMYVFGESTPSFSLEPTVIVVVMGILLALIAAFGACHRLLSHTAVSLMKGEAIRTDWKRILITTVSVAGCMALLVIGFSLKFAVDGVMDKQYGEIVKYDKKVRFNPDASDTVAGDIESVLKDAGTDYLQVLDKFTTYQVDRSMELSEMICGDTDRLNDFFAVKNVKNGKIMTIPSDSILIQKRLAETYGLKKGDTFKIFDDFVNGYEATVGGVFNNYTGRAMVISEDYYQTLFHIPCPKDTYFVKLNGADEKALLASLRKIKGFTSMSRSDTSRTLFASISVVLNGVIILLIVLAAIMASVVLLNLANLYVMQKKKELCIMRINGFTIFETTIYAAKEVIVTTIAGIAVGLLSGMGLAYWIIRTLEQPHIQLVRTPNPISLILSAVITLLFAFIVNALAFRKIKGFLIDY